MTSKAAQNSVIRSRGRVVGPLSADLSPELAHLTREQRERLTDVLDRYLTALEKDAPLSQQALLDENEDIAPALASYFRSLEDLHDMAAGFGGGGSSPAILEETPKG